MGGSEVDASPAKLLADLGKFAAQPRPHKQLLDVANRDPLHKTTVEPNLDDVKAEIRKFLKGSHY